MYFFPRGYDNRRDDHRSGPNDHRSGPNEQRGGPSDHRSGPNDRREVVRREPAPRDRDDRGGRPEERYNKYVYGGDYQEGQCF